MLKLTIKNIKNKLKIILGVLLMPVVFLIFITDRFILFFLFWRNSNSLGYWLALEKEWGGSILRVCVFIIIYCLYLFFKWIF